ncbi:hypothetical protein DFA_09038 [Cavenderia fasciculata]|uniref:Tetratricopeptide-like helical domain-containing protein n=1 Tax=Cavenderia fasciculata TaxID=261658 RepID=F4Q6J0_CACFS|nr:uncharacterized protein DFA_09038 [Cavenderia fasciculata]EGG16500.1 hypothetical protein DFA_09038 [Cavenderia fasciculata]|eukprot:XP_004354900.1 hypothetical protein DFA_09038 [Cavenderia fasciculata]
MLQSLVRSTTKSALKRVAYINNSRSFATKKASISSTTPKTEKEIDQENAESKIYTFEEAILLKASNEKSSNEWLANDSVSTIEKHLNDINKKLSDFYTLKKETIDIQVKKPTQVSVAEKCLNLVNRAEMFLETREFEKAETLLLGAQRLIGEESSLVKGYITSHLATISHEKHQYESAKNYYEESIKLLESESDNNFYGSTLLNYADLLSCTDRMEESVDSVRKAISLFQSSTIKSTDERIYFAQHNLSALLCHQGKFDEAVELSKSAFNGFQRSFGNDNEMVRAAATNLAQIYKQLKMTNELEQLDSVFANQQDIAQEIVDSFETSSKDIDHINLSELGKTWSEQGHQRAFDISGFHKSSTTSKRQLGAFFREMNKQNITMGLETFDLLNNEISSLDYAADRIGEWQPRTYNSLPNHLQ